MSEIVARVSGWCAAASLPEPDEFYAAFTNDQKLFIEVEGPLWDFKREWPFSLSDEYFGGIARLMCAFSNMSGGVIIFGVHDESRTGGHNKVSINFDKFSAAISQLLTSLPTMVFKSYSSEVFGNVDALLIIRRSAAESPVRFTKNVGKYKEKTIWVRSGHEVVSALPSHYPVLFCRKERVDDDPGGAELDGSIPPNPATLRRFVGRAEVLAQLFSWLQNSDEPRTYLYGKGGSGKTTIAHEFAKLIKLYGSSLHAYGGDSIDSVIFLSAKEKSLSTVESRIVDVDPDFTSEKELLIKILEYGGWLSDITSLENEPVDSLRKSVKDYFDISSTLLVIDDIDTFTTKGVDPAADFLYKTLCRSQRTSKIVYTIRNAPAMSLINSIEVPGLKGEEYEAFINECVAQFSAPIPSKEFKEGRLKNLSESRPLVIENIIMLVRTAGSYENAANLFEQRSGDDIRDYVFSREWDALANNRIAKFLLAAIAEFGGPSSFSELEAVLQADGSAIRDAVGAVREMFLQVDDAGKEALYTLAPLTRSFVDGRKSELVGYTALRERVRAYRRNIAASNPRVASISTQIERLLPHRIAVHPPEKVRDALRIVLDRSLPVVVAENQLFKCIAGYVLCCCDPPRLMEAREAFEDAILMKHEPEFKFLRSWYSAERRSGAHDGKTIRIADFVLNGKRYNEREKGEMLAKKGSSLYARGRERVSTDPTDAEVDFRESLKCNLRAFRRYCITGDYYLERTEEWSRNTAYQLFSMLANSERVWEVFDLVRELSLMRDVYLDPLERPFEDITRSVIRSKPRVELIHRIRARQKAASDVIFDRDRWLAKDTVERVEKVLTAFDSSLRALTLP